MFENIEYYSTEKNTVPGGTVSKLQRLFCGKSPIYFRRNSRSDASMRLT